MIGIVGGGISGLFLLHLLREAKVEAVLFEASSVPGGVMRSRAVDGPGGTVPVDLGPQRIRLTPGLSRIVADVGLRDAVLYARPGLPFTIFHRGRLHPAPTSVGAALRTPLISWTGKIRALVDLVAPAPRPDESVAHALRRKLGRQIYRRLAGPVLGGLYASRPEEMEARHTLLPILERSGARRSLLVGLVRASRGEGPPVVSFEEGLGMLPSALAERHADRIRMDAPVRTISPENGGYRLVSDGGALSVERVVLAVPASEAAEVLREAATDAADRLATLRYNPLAIVPLVVPAGSTVPEVGSGFKMTLDDARATRGVTSHHALFGREGLFTAFLGGRGRENLVELTDAEILGLAAADYEAVTGVAATPLFVHRTAMPAWDRSWAALDGFGLPPRLHLCSAFAARPGVMGRLADARRLADRLIPR